MAPHGIYYILPKGYYNLTLIQWCIGTHFRSCYCILNLTTIIGLLICLYLISNLINLKQTCYKVIVYTEMRLDCSASQVVPQCVPGFRTSLTCIQVGLKVRCDCWCNPIIKILIASKVFKIDLKVITVPTVPRFCPKTIKHSIERTKIINR